MSLPAYSLEDGRHLVRLRRRRRHRRAYAQTRKSIYGFPSVFYMGMGLRYKTYNLSLLPRSREDIEQIIIRSRATLWKNTTGIWENEGHFWIVFNVFFSLAPSTLIRFKTKTELFCYGYGYRAHYNAENALQSGTIWKQCFWKRWFLEWTEKTMLSENGDVIKIDTTGRQTTRQWVSKMADRLYHVVSISRQFRRPISWNAHASSSFEHVHWEHKSGFKTDTAL